MNDGGRADTVFGLLDAALRLPPADREAWIRSAAVDDGVRDEALAMLAVVSAEQSAPGSRDDGPAPTLMDAQLGDFRVIRPIGSGAGGVVYEAEQRLPRRRVALKVLRATGSDAGERAAAEAQSLAMFRHPGIASVIAAGTAPVPGGSVAAWIAMELIEGARTVVDHCAGTRDRREVAHPLIAMADAIGAAHRAGVLHRDVKPANLLVGADGVAKVVDFGVASAAGMAAEPAGTPRWMAPECAAGGPASTRSDVWSLGRVLASDQASPERRARGLALLEECVSLAEGLWGERHAMAFRARSDLSGCLVLSQELDPARRALAERMFERNRTLAAGMSTLPAEVLVDRGNEAALRERDGDAPGAVKAQARTIPEPHGSWVPLIEAAWLERYGA